MNDVKQPEPLTFGHILGFLYLTFAHFTDGEITDEELSEITAKIGEWMGDEDPLGENTISETIDWYNSIKEIRLDTFDSLLTGFKKMTRWNNDRLVCILDDLVDIAKADGNYDEEEKEWIRLFADVLELDYKV